MHAARNHGHSKHGALLLALILVMACAQPEASWPWQLLVPLLAYGTMVLLIRPLRRTFPPLAMGRFHGKALVWTATVIIGTSAVLVAFHNTFHPDVTALSKRLPMAFFRSVLFAGIVFSVVNAVMEELIFRGVFWEAIADDWNAKWALLFTSLLFGLGHLHGYPPGLVGAALAVIYGLALGLLRQWSGGLALPIVCHICADATIFGIMFWSGSFSDAAV